MRTTTSRVAAVLAAISIGASAGTTMAGINDPVTVDLETVGIDVQLGTGSLLGSTALDPRAPDNRLGAVLFCGDQDGTTTLRVHLSMGFFPTGIPVHLRATAPGGEDTAFEQPMVARSARSGFHDPILGSTDARTFADVFLTRGASFGNGHTTVRNALSHAANQQLRAFSDGCGNAR